MSRRFQGFPQVGGVPTDHATHAGRHYANVRSGIEFSKPPRQRSKDARRVENQNCRIKSRFDRTNSRNQSDDMTLLFAIIAVACIGLLIAVMFYNKKLEGQVAAANQETERLRQHYESETQRVYG